MIIGGFDDGVVLYQIRRERGDAFAQKIFSRTSKVD